MSTKGNVKINEVKHTPGPWRLFKVGEGNFIKFCPATSDGMSILTIVEEGDMQFAAVFKVEDARLIVAAPEMLIALQDAMYRLAQLGLDTELQRTTINKATEDEV